MSMTTEAMQTVDEKIAALEKELMQTRAIASRYQRALKSIRQRGRDWEKAGKRGAVGWRDQLILCAEDADEGLSPNARS